MTSNSHWASYVRSGTSWWSAGFSLIWNSMIFNGKHTYYGEPGCFRGCGGNGRYPYQVLNNRHKPYAAYLEPWNYSIYRSGGTCKTSGRNRNRNLCPREFIVIAPGRFQGIGDIESQSGSCAGDNRANYDFRVYVR